MFCFVFVLFCSQKPTLNYASACTIERHKINSRMTSQFSDVNRILPKEGKFVELQRIKVGALDILIKLCERFVVKCALQIR